MIVDGLTNDELGVMLVDYHRLLYGYDITSEGIFQSRRLMLAKVAEIDYQVQKMMESFDGRESLRGRGFRVKEVAPRLIQRANQLEVERKCCRRFNVDMGGAI